MLRNGAQASIDASLETSSIAALDAILECFATHGLDALHRCVGVNFHESLIRKVPVDLIAAEPHAKPYDGNRVANRDITGRMMRWEKRTP